MMSDDVGAILCTRGNRRISDADLAAVHEFAELLAEMTKCRECGAREQLWWAMNGNWRGGLYCVDCVEGVQCEYVVLF